MRNYSSLIINCGIGILLTVGLSGCITSAFIASSAIVGGSLVYDQRGLTAIKMDTAITKHIARTVQANKEVSNNTHLNFTVFNRVVLLTGQALDEGNYDFIVNLAKNTPNVRKVVNHLKLEDQNSLATRGRDTLLTAAVKTALLQAYGLKSTQIKVLSENGVVYLLGKLSASKREIVLKLVKGTKHVHAVVDLLELEH
jgi:osmotically-inducible protein OsmY